jgi:hypothetical protein
MIETLDGQFFDDLDELMSLPIEELENGIKKQTRLSRNRLSARLSRLRQKEHLEELLGKVTLLELKNNELHNYNIQLVKHNRKLIYDNRFLFQNICAPCVTQMTTHSFCLPK